MSFFISLVIGLMIGASLIISAMALTGGFSLREPLPHPDDVEEFIKHKANF